MSAIACQITTASWLFTQLFIQAQMKENKAPRYWPLCVEFTGDRWLPAKMASNAEKVYIWCHRHDLGSAHIVY